MRRISGLFKSGLTFTTIFVFFLYLPVVSIPFINTGENWFVALLGLIFPITLFLIVCLFFAWLLLRSKWAWICFAVIICGAQQIFALIGFNVPRNFVKEKRSGTLRIMQWNVTSWDEGYHEKNPRRQYREDMLQLVKDQDADILCFQEFFEPYENISYEPNISPIVQMGYPYYYFVPSFSYKRDFGNGITIFSKYPISDSASTPLSSEKEGENILYCDIKIKDQQFRVITTHLQSVRFNENDYASIRQIKSREEGGLKDSRSIIRKLKMGYTRRYQQAALLAKQIQTSPYPVVLCADFNDIPNSNTYFTVKGGLQDAFLKKGVFFGRTFRFISPTLRIDYIMADEKFKILQQKIIHVPYSDHYPLVADMEFRD